MGQFIRSRSRIDLKYFNSHAQSPYPVPTVTDSCGSWTLIENVCCPTYCEDVLTSEDCTSYTAAECGACISPPAADCMSGTMYNETLSVNSDEAWHYSVRQTSSLETS